MKQHSRLGMNQTNDCLQGNQPDWHAAACQAALRMLNQNHRIHQVAEISVFENNS
jgi:hypothetical protein